MISEVKASAAAGIRYHALGQHIAEDAWGGDEAAHILAITLGICAVVYDEASGQMWIHNNQAQSDNVIRLLYLERGRYRILKPAA